MGAFLHDVVVKLVGLLHFLADSVGTLPLEPMVLMLLLLVTDLVRQVFLALLEFKCLSFQVLGNSDRRPSSILGSCRIPGSHCLLVVNIYRHRGYRAWTVPVTQGDWSST